MKDIAHRIRALRALLDISRKEVEMRSEGRIKATSLSTFENAQSTISIPYLRQLVYFYQTQGIVVGFDWLITGNGPRPSHRSVLESNISVIQEVAFFRKTNQHAIIHTATESLPFLYIEQGDIIGAVRTEKNMYRTAVRLFRLTSGESKIMLTKIFDGNVMTFDLSQTRLQSLPLETVEEIYDVVWLRKFL